MSLESKLRGVGRGIKNLALGSILALSAYLPSGCGGGGDNPSNPAPFFTPAGDAAVSVDENQYLEYDLGSVSDGGGPPISSITIDNLPAWASFDDATLIVSGIPSYNDSGIGTVTVTASNGTQTITKDLEITVNNVNRAPTVGVSGTTSVTEGGVIEVQFNVNDADGDAVGFTVNGPLGADFDSANTFLSWVTNYSDGDSNPSNYTVSYSADDGMDITSGSVVLSVLNDSNPKRILANTNYPGGAFLFNTYSFLPDGTDVQLEGAGIGVRPRFNPVDSTTMTLNKPSGSYQSGFLEKRDGSTSTKITNNTTYNIRELAMSPNGTMVAYYNQQDGNVYVGDFDGSNPLTNERAIGVGGFPVFSMDNQWVLYQKDDGGQQEVYKRKADGSGLEINLTNSISSDDGAPAVSPDGTRFAFTSDRDIPGVFNIYTASMTDGSNVQKVTDVIGDSGDQSGAQYPSYSADGNWIVYSDLSLTGSSFTKGDLYKTKIDGVVENGRDGKYDTAISDYNYVFIAPHWEK